jgi:tRNA (adenine37-N6)-methyltransferase
LKKITIKPIGKVKNSIKKIKRDGWDSLVSKVILNPGYEEALEGIEAYSHLWVLFWISRMSKKRLEMKKIHPKSLNNLPLVGIFATRTQYRPNPIGLTLVKLLGRNKNVLLVQGLDALNGTPIIDIKPISPHGEFLKTAKVPKWYHKLWEKNVP